MAVSKEQTEAIKEFDTALKEAHASRLAKAKRL
jgi:hypothetical protein